MQRSGDDQYWPVAETVVEQIAQALRLSEGTIRNAIARITIKLGVVDRTQAALLAYHSGLDLEDTLRTPGTGIASIG